MHAVEIVDEPREEHDLDRRDLSEGLFEPGPEDVAAVIRLHSRARWVADYYPVESVEELGEGRLEVRLRVGDPRWLVRLALRLSPWLEIVEPAGLREDAARTAEATLRLYAGFADGAEDDGVA